MSNIIEIPRYQSHKQVQALKIKLAIMNPRGVELHFVDERYCPIQMPVEFARKHTDGQGVQALAGGYVVWYEDGYTSWSPAEAFESGYTMLGNVNAAVSSSGAIYYNPESHYHAAEEAEALSMALDKAGVPRADADGTPFSLWGRVCRLAETKPTCTDERPCVNCFSGQGLCLSKPTQAALDVLAERRRQVEAEGWTPEHDDKYPGGQLACAAIAYLMVGVNPNGARLWWPWDAKFWKPSPDTRRNLIKAGALLLADIEWLDRLRAKLADPAKQEPLAGRVCSKVSAVAAEADDLTQFLEQTDFDAAEKVASEKVDAKPLPTAGEDDCDGCKI